MYNIDTTLQTTDNIAQTAMKRFVIFQQKIFLKHNHKMKR